MNHTIWIWFDGGCFPNPGQKYGSFQVNFDGQQILNRHRGQCNRGTNNEPEFNSLQMALEETDDWLAEKGIPMAEVNCVIETDSKIVQHRITKKNKIHSKPVWRESSERMFALAQEVLKILIRFGVFEVRWKPRENNVERFGH